MLRVLIFASFLALLLAPHGADAQIIASERGAVSQTIDGTMLEIAYSRPSLRGRSNIFRTEIPDSVLWTPGADWATTLNLSKGITIEGVDVPEGLYSVWMAVTTGDWEVFLDPNHRKFHLPHPSRTDSQYVFTVTPDTSAVLVETLQFSFPTVSSTGGLLRFNWERTQIDMAFDVQPSRVLTVDDAVATPYLGRYKVHIPENPDWDQPSHDFEFEMKLEDGYMGGPMNMFPGWPAQTMYFAPAADQVFNLVFTINGSVAGVWDTLFIEFLLGDDGRSTTFEARDGEDDTLFMKGERIAEP